MYKIVQSEQKLVFDAEFQEPISPEITKLSEGLRIIEFTDFYEDIIGSCKKFRKVVF